MVPTGRSFWIYSIKNMIIKNIHWQTNTMQKMSLNSGVSQEWLGSFRSNRRIMSLLYYKIWYDCAILTLRTFTNIKQHKTIEMIYIYICDTLYITKLYHLLRVIVYVSLYNKDFSLYLLNSRVRHRYFSAIYSTYKCDKRLSARYLMIKERKRFGEGLQAVIKI